MRPTQAARCVPALLMLSYVCLALEVYALPGLGWAFVGAAVGFMSAAAIVFGSFLAFPSPAAVKSEPAPPARRTWAVVAALLAGTLFIGIGWRTLSVSHPHEDAYILFRYVEHIAAGHGIVFNVGGPRAEGATDFLWLILLSGLRWLGVDVAIAALCLNAFGAGIVAWLLHRTFVGVPRSSHLAWATTLVFPIVVVLSHGASASYLGFGTMLYSALVLVLVRLGMGPERDLAWIPVVGLTVSLFRPDGVVVGVAFSLVGLFLFSGQRPSRRYVQVLVGCGIAGVAYFVWRYAYFGLPLPLPLYVKGQGRLLDVPGVEEGLRWLGLSISPLPALAGAGVFAGLLARARRLEVARAMACLVPPALLWGVFLFVAPLQNYAWRYQAPVSLAIVMVFTQLSAWAIASYPDRAQRLTTLAVLFVAIGVPLRDGYVWVRDVVKDDVFQSYFETLAPAFGAHVNGNQAVVALTEAGRLPYWFSGIVEDMVGLNSPVTAVTPPSRAYLDAIGPDVVMFHHSRTLDLSVDPSSEPPPLITPLTRSRLAAAVRPRYGDLWRTGLSRYADTPIRRNEVAAVLLTKYLVESDRYDLVAVDHRRNGTYRHVWGFRKDWPLTQTVIDLIQVAGEADRYCAYLDVRRLPRLRAPGLCS